MHQSASNELCCPSAPSLVAPVCELVYREGMREKRLPNSFHIRMSYEVEDAALCSLSEAGLSESRSALKKDPAPYCCSSVYGNWMTCRLAIVPISGPAGPECGRIAEYAR